MASIFRYSPSSSSLALRSGNLRNPLIASDKVSGARFGVFNQADKLKLENKKSTSPIDRNIDRTMPALTTRGEAKSLSNNNDNNIKIFSGTANPALSQEIVSFLGLELGRIHIKRFADGDVSVNFLESVKGCDVYLVQPTCPPADVNLLELLLMIDACRRASAKSITVGI